MTALRVIFCGHHRAGVLVLESLLSAPERYEVIWVWTIPETAESAGVSKTVAEMAAQRGIAVFVGSPGQGLTPEELRGARPDLIVCSNYRYLLPQALYASARLGAINVHGSLLPCYRGRMPNCWAIIHGESVTGVTAHRIDEGVDTGPILAQERIAIDWRDTAATLVAKQIERCPSVIAQGIANLLDPAFVPRKQSGQEASTFPRRSNGSGTISWDWPARRLYDWIRAQTHPYAGASTTHRGRPVTVWGAAYSMGSGLECRSAREPGTILGVLVSPECSGVWVATGSDPLALTSVSYDGRSAGSPYELVLSKEWNEGDRLGG